MTHLIEKLGQAQFNIEWKDEADSLIHLDFRPLLDNYRLNYNPSVLEHWQAKPFGLRRWGLYDIIYDTYYSAEAENIIFGRNLDIRNLQIPEKNYPTIRPTAVKLYSKCIVTDLGNNRYMVGQV